jgi:drug/metabolite transporter (DMT)-like permease
MTDVCGVRCSKVFIADLQILGAAVLFGIGFIGQRAVSVEGLGPMTCNTMRFGLSAIMLMILKPWIPQTPPDPEDEDDDEFVKASGTLLDKDKPVKVDTQLVLTKLFGPNIAANFEGAKKTVLFWGIFLGAVNFGASGFQQWGITMTSASKVAFIAGFDLFLTPIFSLFLPTSKHNGKPTATTWMAVCISIVGLFLLSDLTFNDLEIGRGETLTLISTVFWTLHIMFTDMATSHIDSLHMMIVQLSMVTMFSAIAALMFEPQTWFLHHILMFMPWLLFLAFTEGMAFTLMALGQAFAPPTHAAIILSLEGVFAAVASYFVLGEHLTSSELVGCSLMLVATLFAEVGCSCFGEKGKAAHGADIERGHNTVELQDDLRSVLGTVVNAAGCLVVAATMPFVRLRDCCRRYRKTALGTEVEIPQKTPGNIA